MSEAELPAAMESHGFRGITTGFATVDLTPDHPKFSSEMDRDIINANRETALDGIETIFHTMLQAFTNEVIETMKSLAKAKYDARIAQYDRSEKQWDTDVSIIMVVRGKK